MKTILLALILSAVSTAAFADEAGDCKAAAGTYLTGSVVRAPYFQAGKRLRGVELSHTHLVLKADQDQRGYDVAIDNVFAAGYDQTKEAVPAPLNTIRVGDRLSLCGQLYTRGVGIHWVHTNCDARPTPAAPNGWVRRLGTEENLEGSAAYCRLW